MKPKRTRRQKRWYSVDSLIPFVEYLEHKILTERREDLSYLQALFHIR